MSPIPFADGFLAGSLISLLLPVGLLIVIAIWYARTIRRLPGDAGRSTEPAPSVSELPPDAAEVQAKAPDSEP
jgi:hypothetical protein